jgi:hypothetical protein
MNLKPIGIVAASVLMLSLPLNDGAFGQRGRGGGGGGWQGGNKGGDGGSNMRSFSRGDSGNSWKSDSGRSQSFYRGDSGRDGDRGDRDRIASRSSDRDRDSSRFSDRDRDRDRDSNRFFDRDRDRGGRDRDFVDRVRRDWDHDWDRGNHRNYPFRYGWWDTVGWRGYPGWFPYGYARWRDRPYYWWGWASPVGLASWLVFDWDRPYYWGYGPGRNIYYEGDYVYYDGRRTMSANDYYAYLDDLASDVPNIDEASAEKMEWKPLGVFAVRRENETNSDRTLQLAINRDGVISGTYFINDKKEAHPVVGRVDKRTQRATWKLADKKDGQDVIFETSLNNLTRDSANVMVHFGPKASDAEVWQLIRLEAPESSSSGQSSEAELPPPGQR